MHTQSNDLSSLSFKQQQKTEEFNSSLCFFFFFFIKFFVFARFEQSDAASFGLVLLVQRTELHTCESPFNERKWN